MAEEHVSMKNISVCATAVLKDVPSFVSLALE